MYKYSLFGDYFSVSDCYYSASWEGYSGDPSLINVDDTNGQFTVMVTDPSFTTTRVIAMILKYHLTTAQGQTTF